MSKCIAIIPARGGSRRIPHKNIRPFHGKPIIAHSIETAKASGLFDRIIVSTDDDEIGDIAKQYGAEYLPRRPELCLDKIGTQEVMGEVLKNIQYSKYACCIYPCAPLMIVDDLKEGYEILKHEEYVSFVMSVGYPPLQDAGQWYFGSRYAFINKWPLIGNQTRMLLLPSERVCDINTEEDCERAEQMYAELHGMAR